MQICLSGSNYYQCKNIRNFICNIGHFVVCSRFFFLSWSLEDCYFFFFENFLLFCWLVYLCRCEFQVCKKHTVFSISSSLIRILTLKIFYSLINNKHKLNFYLIKAHIRPPKPTNILRNLLLSLSYQVFFFYIQLGGIHIIYQVSEVFQQFFGFRVYFGNMSTNQSNEAT